jgi:hypothetical protein
MTPARALTAFALCCLVLAGVAGADGTPLQGSVGPGFSISLSSASGAKITHLDPGSYSLVVDDESDEHNFHIEGPGGVNARTEVVGTGPSTFPLTLVDGTYTFICDAHPTRMTGTFTVGGAQPAPTPKPAVQKLVLTLTATAVTLTKPGGARIAALATGPALITVRDRSATRGVKLRGAGVVKATGIGFIGTLTWSVKLGAGPLTLTTQGKTPALKGRRVTVSSKS